MISKLLIIIDQFPFCISLEKFCKNCFLFYDWLSGRKQFTQPLLVVYDIYSSFDCYPSLKVRGIFLERHI